MSDQTQNQTIRLIMISFHSYGRQIQFFKKILIRGDFNQSAKFLTAFQSKLDQGDYKKIMVQLYKQKLYQLIQNPDEAQLKILFQREIINYCSEQEYQNYFTYLTCKSVHDIPGMSQWSLTQGRLICFQTILPYFDGLFNGNNSHFGSGGNLNNDEIQGNLQEIVSNYFKKQSSKIQQSNPNANANANVNNNNNNNNFSSNHSSSNSNQNNSNNRQTNNKVQQQQQQQQQQLNQNSSIHSSNVNTNSMNQGYKKHGQKLSKDDILKSDLYQSNPKIQTGSIKSSQRGGINNNSKMMKNSKLIGSVINKKVQIGSSQVQQQPQIKQSSQIQLSQSNYEKSQMMIQKSKNNYNINQPKGYANLHGTKSNKFDQQNSRDLDFDIKNSSVQHQAKSQAYQFNPYQSSQIQQQSSMSYEQLSQKSQRIANYSHNNNNNNNNTNNNNQDYSNKNLKESNSAKRQYMYKKPLSKIEIGVKQQINPYQETLQQQVKKNIAYLQQNNSVVYKNDDSNQNFTFSNNADLQEKQKKVTKLTSISDAKAIRTCQFTQSGKYFALGTNSSLLKIFDVEELYAKNQYQEQIKPIYQIQNLHKKSIFCLQWSSSQKAVITCSNDLQIRLTQFFQGMGSHRSNVIGRHQNCIRMVKFNNLQSKIFSCDDKGLIKIWDLGKITKCTDLKGHKDNGISAFKLSQNQNQAILYSVGKDSLIKKWDLRTGQNQVTSKKQDSQLTYIASNTDKIVVSHKNGTVSFFNPSLQLQYSQQIHQQQIRSIDANVFDQSFITSSFDGSLGIFNQKNMTNAFYHKHNQNQEDKVVFATFLQHPDINGFASTSTLGLCHLYSYQ